MDTKVTNQLTARIAAGVKAAGAGPLGAAVAGGAEDFRARLTQEQTRAQELEKKRQKEAHNAAAGGGGARADYADAQATSALFLQSKGPFCRRKRGKKRLVRNLICRLLIVLRGARG